MKVEHYTYVRVNVSKEKDKYLSQILISEKKTLKSIRKVFVALLQFGQFRSLLTAALKAE